MENQEAPNHEGQYNPSGHGRAGLVLTGGIAHGAKSPLVVETDSDTVRISNTNAALDMASWEVESSPTLTIPAGLSEFLPEGAVLRLKSITLGQEGDDKNNKGNNYAAR